MPGDKKVRHLSIFLVKDGYKTASAVIHEDACDAPVDVPISGLGKCKLYIKKTRASPPKWASLFEDYLDIRALAVPGVSAALVVQRRSKCFVLTFGQGGRFLLKDDVWEDRFGLHTALNSVDPKSFRCIDVQSLDAIQSHTRIQSGEETTSDQFGLDVEQDMLKAIVGAPLNPALGTRMTGGDALQVAVKMDLADLSFLLDEYRKKFEADLSEENYQWVNNISAVKSGTLITALETELDARLGVKQLKDIWLSIPEIIDWTAVKGFMYTNGGSTIYPDVNFDGFLKTVKAGTQLTVSMLRQRKVMCADSEHKPVFKSWPAFKCLYAEIDLGGDKYILNDGRWFGVATDFVKKTDAGFAKIPQSKLKLPEYKGNGEGAYNASVAAAEPAQYALLDDKHKVMHGGGHGQVEVCDLLSMDRELIHVKIYSKSSVISHLFAQGFVSGQLIQVDAEFRKKVIAKLKGPFAKLLEAHAKPAQDQFTVVYAVISDVPGKLYLPFFSRVNLNNTTKVLRGFGYKVELLKISWDSTYAKTAVIPPKKQRGESRSHR
jgi:uncharacterized protein (TIGR04141 family)